MVPSSVLCRAQERLHLSRAADTALENVRRVATNAATAWAREAVVAEHREARQLRVRAFANANGGGAPDIAANTDLLLSENPDRGFATPRAIS